MRTILQLDPPIWLHTPQGQALAHFLVWESMEHNILWVSAVQNSGIWFTFDNSDVRAQENYTLGRPKSEMARLCAYNNMGMDWGDRCDRCGALGEASGQRPPGCKIEGNETA